MLAGRRGSGPTGCEVRRTSRGRPSREVHRPHRRRPSLLLRFLSISRRLSFGAVTDRGSNPSNLLDDPLLRDAPVVDGYKFLAPVLIYQRLGEGGMGAVYRGRHTNLDVDVAVKVLKPELAQADPSYVMRFLGEAQMAVRLDHQNLIRVLDVQTRGRLCYMVMDLVAGETAAARVARKGPLAEDEAVRIVLAAADGLATAHAVKPIAVVHRDIKPDNILIGTDGKVKVADLGLARLADGGQGLTQAGIVVGTPQYMAPEQWEGSRLDPRVDVWALGATLWFLLAGKNPFERSSHGREIPDLGAVRHGVRAELLAVLQRCTATARTARFANAGELGAALRPLLAGGGSLADDGATSALPATVVSPPPDARTVEMARTVQSANDLMPVATAVRAEPPPPRVAAPSLGTDAAPRGRSWRMPLALGLVLLLLVLVPAMLWAGGWFDGERREPGQQPPPGPGARETSQLRPAERLLDDLATLDEGVRQLEDLRRDHATLPGLSAALARGYAAQIGRDGKDDPVGAFRTAAKWAAGADADAATKANEAEARLATAVSNRLVNGNASSPKWDCEVLDPAWGEKTGYPRTVRDRATQILFLLVEPGEFAMGSAAEGEGPVHTVVLTKPFYLAETETTQAQWKRLMTDKRNPSAFAGDQRPVDSVTWSDVEIYLHRLNGGAEGPFRLPSEAEWEYACRATTTTDYWFGAKITTDDAQYGNSGTVDVANFPANGLGFHDLHGNVWEWCRDWFDPGYYATCGPRIADPPGPGPTGDNRRVARGGSFRSLADQLRSSTRAGFQPGARRDVLGFRVARSL